VPGTGTDLEMAMEEMEIAVLLIFYVSLQLQRLIYLGFWVARLNRNTAYVV